MATLSKSDSDTSYVTPSGLVVSRREHPVGRDEALGEVVAALDERRGVLLSSGYEYPGRYTRWDVAFVDPPLVLTGVGREFQLEALNKRGELLIAAAVGLLEGHPHLEHLAVVGTTRIEGRVAASAAQFPEEKRSQQPSLFSVLRALTQGFGSPADAHLGLYGAFGYDLCFQFEPVPLRHERPKQQRDLVLYLPDRLVVVDRHTGRSSRFDYEFSFGDRSTSGLERTGATAAFEARQPGPKVADHEPIDYVANVKRAQEAFLRGDLFELVLSQTFHTPCSAPPSTLFRRLERRNPAPFAFLINLGRGEYLVGASPEMYVRVEGRRVETCPISGTIARGADPIEDELRIRELLNSAKDESELTMCTDVDRNDKSRICEPGSVRILGRRQIELYSKLIHTVDHVEGILRADYDAFDAFLSHTWAVTVTGAPKPAAIRRIEHDERSPRAWYGGAVGVVGFDGNLNTGLTLRTIRVIDGRAEVRAGATLLYDSVPEAEEAETRLKASALLEAVLVEEPQPSGARIVGSAVGHGVRILLVDHEDSFVHTLANYLRQTGAEVTTRRGKGSTRAFDDERPDMVVLSPGPGRPSEFGLSATLAWALERQLPVFGVCLGLQGIVEYFGGRLEQLGYPMHGKPSEVVTQASRLFSGLPERFVVGRYHSLVAAPEALPGELRAIAHTRSGDIMAIEHATLPIMAVQFHPESIMTSAADTGLRMVENVVGSLRRPRIGGGSLFCESQAPAH